MQEKVRLKDLAEKLNISITTVSKALNGHPDISEKRRKEIIEYAASVNYVPNQVAKNFRQQRTNTVGIILSDNAYPYNSRMLHGMEETLAASGYYPIFVDSHQDARRELELIRSLHALNVGGVLLTPSHNGRESCDLLTNFQIPYVLARGYIDPDQDAYVVVDDRMVSYMSVKYLSSYDGNKIFFINSMERLPSAQNRLLGYRQALADYGIKEEDDWVIQNCIGQQGGYEVMKQLLRRHKPPFSVICYSDYVATGMICALQERKIQIPSEVAIMGADNIAILSYVKPRLTTIDLPKKRLGQRAAEVLVEMIEHPSNDAPIDFSKMRCVFQPRLIIRETS